LKKPDINRYIESLLLSLKLDEFFNPRKQHNELQYEQEHFTNVFIMLASGLSLSLREVEQLLSSINIAIRTANELEYIFPALLVFLIVSKHYKADAYQRYISEDGDESELIDYLHQIVPEKNRDENFPCALVEGFLISAKNHKTESSILLRHKDMINDEELNYEKRQYSETVVNVVNRPAGIGVRVNLSKLSSRIEWLSRFEFLDVEG
jgi:hypothetical protein